MTMMDIMPTAVIRRGTVIIGLFRAFDVEPEENEPRTGAELGEVGPDSDMEDLLDGGLEVAGDGDGERKGGVVLALLDGVDALSGHAQGGSELGRGPRAGGARRYPRRSSSEWTHTPREDVMFA